MERTKFKSKSKEPPKILLPELSGRILRILTSPAYQLWYFYRDCAEYQNTDQIRCKYEFIMSPKGLGWTRNKIARYNSELQEKGLIELFQRRKGIDWGHSYVKIFFTMDEDKLKAAELQRSITGRSISTDRFNKKSNKIKSVSSLNEPANIENYSVVRRTRSTRHTYYINALKSSNKQSSGTHPVGGIPSDKKNIESKSKEIDNLPLRRTSHKKVKYECPEDEDSEGWFGEMTDHLPACKKCKLHEACKSEKDRLDKEEDDYEEEED